MNDLIPPATAAKLAEHTPKGERHKAAMDIALSLIGNGLPEQAVFATLRSKFDEGKSDAELWKVVRWASDKNPTPSLGNAPATNGRSYPYVPKPTAQPPKRSPLEQCDWWTNGARVTAEKCAGMSPVPIPDSPRESAVLAFSALFSDADYLNIVCKFLNDGDKPKPCGGGKTLKRDAWIEYFNREGVPHSEAGAWMRINPCSPSGTGNDGSITDADIAGCKYLLVESDILPIAAQLGMFVRLRLPVAAIILSGGGSAHAWIRLDAVDLKTYREMAERILGLLKPYGYDLANKNASRLCRVPGAVRTLGASGDGLQRLLWLNPTAPAITPDALQTFEESLAFPAIEEKPLLSIARDALQRYDYMRQNVGKLGVPYGVPALDSISGGMKKGQTIVVAGTTGGGKSTFGLHMIDSALTAGHGVALFSLEMDKEEVFDLLVSRRAKINRNKFNTGEFSDRDSELIADEIKNLIGLPLYIEDSAMSGAEQIRVRVMQLKSAGKIGLVVVDYIQFVNPGLTKESREQQVAGISNTLRALARETKLPFVILSQLNDEGRLRESRVIAHNANVVIVVEAEEEKFTAKVIKGRGIPCQDYEMEFDRLHALLVPYKQQTSHNHYSDQEPT